MKLTNIIKEIRYPATVDDLTMSFLYMGINNAAEKILKDIKKRTGSNANPISLQVIEGLNSVNKQLMKKKNLKILQIKLIFFGIKNIQIDKNNEKKV